MLEAHRHNCGAAARVTRAALTVVMCLAWQHDSRAEDDAGAAAPTAVSITVGGDSDENAEIWPQGLPALSKAGNEVAFIADRAEYNDSGWTELRVASKVKATVKRRLLTEYQSEFDAPPVAPAARAEGLRKAAKEAQTLLMAGGFAPLVAVHDAGGGAEISVADIEKAPLKVGRWSLSYREGSRTLLVLDEHSKVMFSRRIAIVKNGWCCSPDPDPPARCLTGYNHVQVWGNDTAIFILGTNWLGPDGCEVSHQYVTIWPAAGKARVSSNYDG
jgi:hypothetical protein